MDLLLVEDDIDLQKVLAEYLELTGFNVLRAHHGKKGLEVFRDSHVDLCILDVMMPHMDGFELATEIRKLDPSMPVIFLTARNQKEDRLRGLNLGADDYITKPFEAEELVLRIKNILKRSGKDEGADVTIGKLHILFDELSINNGIQTHQMTPREGDLLRYLLDHKNSVVKREEILEELWGENDYFLGRSMDVFISRIRKYIEPEPSVKLLTKRGMGFVLKCP